MPWITGLLLLLAAAPAMAPAPWGPGCVQALSAARARLAVTLPAFASAVVQLVDEGGPKEAVVLRFAPELREPGHEASEPLASVSVIAERRRGRPSRWRDTRSFIEKRESLYGDEHVFGASRRVPGRSAELTLRLPARRATRLEPTLFFQIFKQAADLCMQGG